MNRCTSTVAGSTSTQVARAAGHHQRVRQARPCATPAAAATPDPAGRSARCAGGPRPTGCRSGARRGPPGPRRAAAAPAAPAPPPPAARPGPRRRRPAAARAGGTPRGSPPDLPRPRQAAAAPPDSEPVPPHTSNGRPQGTVVSSRSPTRSRERMAIAMVGTRLGMVRRVVVRSATLFGQCGEELVDLLPDARAAGQPLPFPADEGDEGEAVVDRREPVLASSAGRVHQQRFHLGRHVGQLRAARHDVAPRRRVDLPPGRAGRARVVRVHGAPGAGNEEGQTDRHAQSLRGYLRQADAATGYEPVVPVAGGVAVEEQRARLADAADLAAVGVEEVPMLLRVAPRRTGRSARPRVRGGAPVG